MKQVTQMYYYAYRQRCKRCKPWIILWEKSQIYQFTRHPFKVSSPGLVGYSDLTLELIQNKGYISGHTSMQFCMSPTNASINLFLSFTSFFIPDEFSIIVFRNGEIEVGWVRNIAHEMKFQQTEDH